MARWKNIFFPWDYAFVAFEMEEVEERYNGIDADENVETVWFPFDRDEKEMESGGSTNEGIAYVKESPEMVRYRNVWRKDSVVSHIENEESVPVEDMARLSN